MRTYSFSRICGVSVFLMAMMVANTASAGDTTRVKPAKGDWGMVLNLTGLIDNIGLSNFEDSIGNNTILFKHYRNQNMAFRFGIGVNMNNRKFSSQDSLKINQELLDKDSVFKQSAYSFSFGMEKHLGNSRRLDPYVGFQATIGIIGKTKQSIDTKILSNTGTETYDRDIVQDGGGLFGFHLIGGFNYFIAERFCLGAEYMFGYNYRKVGGNYSDTEIYTPASGSSSSTLEKGEFSVSDNDITPSAVANITLSYYFGKTK